MAEDLPAGPASGRLNEFQRTMLQWSGLHPYNAVHVARLPRVVGADRFAAAAEQVLAGAGLTNYAVRRSDGRYRYESGEVEVIPRVVEGDGDALGAARAEMARQLNESFPWDGLFQPFRFFLVKGGEETFLGLAYFHVVADAESVGRLLREIVSTCFEGGTRPHRDPGLSHRGSSRNPRGTLRGALGRALAAYGKMQRMRRSFRSPDCPSNDFHNDWFGRSLDEADSARVLGEARRRGVTVNDLCLAALLQAVIPWTGERFEKTRQHLSAGCVVNLRRDLPPSRRGDFGLHLGSFSVTHAMSPGLVWDELLASVHEQTEEVKRRKLYLASRLEFRINRYLFARKSLEKQRNFYRKAYPVWGSITNFKMEDFAGETWEATEYHRAVSAGPALPFVIGVTGFRGRLHFGFSYRPAVIGEAAVRDIADRFLGALRGEEAGA